MPQRFGKASGAVKKNNKNIFVTEDKFDLELTNKKQTFGIAPSGNFCEAARSALASASPSLSSVDIPETKYAAERLGSGGKSLTNSGDPEKYKTVRSWQLLLQLQFKRDVSRQSPKSAVHLISDKEAG
jgi:hypothetical protein